MLGEKHSLTNDFPELKQVIEERLESDPAFVKENKKYTQVDKEIRILELNNAPIDDDEMHRLKQERALLKDELYAKLTGNPIM